MTEKNAGVHHPLHPLCVSAESIFIQRSTLYGDEQVTSHFFKKLILLKGQKSKIHTLYWISLKLIVRCKFAIQIYKLATTE